MHDIHNCTDVWVYMYLYYSFVKNMFVVTSRFRTIHTILVGFVLNVYLMYEGLEIHFFNNMF